MYCSSEPHLNKSGNLIWGIPEPTSKKTQEATIDLDIASPKFKGRLGKSKHLKCALVVEQPLPLEKIVYIGSGSRGISKTYNLTWYCSCNPLPDHRHQPTSLSNSSCMQYSLPSLHWVHANCEKKMHEAPGIPISQLDLQMGLKEGPGSLVRPSCQITVFPKKIRPQTNISLICRSFHMDASLDVVELVQRVHRNNCWTPLGPLFLKDGEFSIQKPPIFTIEVSFFAKFISHMEMLDSKGGE